MLLLLVTFRVLASVQKHLALDRATANINAIFVAFFLHFIAKMATKNGCTCSFFYFPLNLQISLQYWARGYVILHTLPLARSSLFRVGLCCLRRIGLVFFSYGGIWFGLSCLRWRIGLAFYLRSLPRPELGSGLFACGFPTAGQIRKRQKTRKSRVQEVSRDWSRIIGRSLIARKHSKTSALGVSYP